MLQKFEYYVQKMGDKCESSSSAAKFTLRIKQLFLNFMIYLINDFEDFYKKESKYGVQHPSTQSLLPTNVSTMGANQSIIGQPPKMVETA